MARLRRLRRLIVQTPSAGRHHGSRVRGRAVCLRGRRRRERRQRRLCRSAVRELRLRRGRRERYRRTVVTVSSCSCSSCSCRRRLLRFELCLGDLILIGAVAVPLLRLYRPRRAGHRNARVYVTLRSRLCLRLDGAITVRRLRRRRLLLLRCPVRGLRHCGRRGFRVGLLDGRLRRRGTVRITALLWLRLNGRVRKTGLLVRFLARRIDSITLELIVLLRLNSRSAIRIAVLILLPLR